MSRIPTWTRVPAGLILLAALSPLYALDALTAQQRMQEAYEKLDTYQSQVIFSVKATGQPEQALPPIEVAFDRGQKRLRVDRPDIQVAVQGEQVTAVVPGFDEAHLATEVDNALDLRRLIETVPPLAQPGLPDLMLLLGEDPLAMAKDGELEVVEPGEGQAQGLQLRSATPHGQLTLTLDPESYLVRRMAMEMRHPQDPRQIYVLTAEVNVRQTGKSIEAEVFALETQGSKRVDSLQTLVAALPPSSPEDLIGKPAPAVELATLDGGKFELATVEHEVVILDFWATWCGPCRIGMKAMQDVQDWADQEGKSVQIYAVNKMETPQQIRPFMKQMGLSLPVLLDRDGSVARKYLEDGIPHSVVIHNGVVQHVHVGVPRAASAQQIVAQQLKAEVEELLAKEE